MKTLKGDYKVLKDEYSRMSILEKTAVVVVGLLALSFFIFGLMGAIQHSFF